MPQLTGKVKGEQRAEKSHLGVKLMSCSKYVTICWSIRDQAAKNVQVQV